jgi:hypothetical protein
MMLLFVEGLPAHLRRPISMLRLRMLKPREVEVLLGEFDGEQLVGAAEEAPCVDVHRFELRL